MREIKGIKIDKLGFQPQKLGDLIFHEGPLLSLFIDKENPNFCYMFKWSDNDQEANRWIITQINSLSLRAFFDKQASLRDIILNNPVCYCVDIDNDLNEKSVLVCASADLPKEYLPGEKSFFSEERYSEFAQTFKTIIVNNQLYDILYRILNEIDMIKKNQTQINSLIDILVRQQPTNQSSYLENVQYINGMSNYEKILN